MCPCPSLILSSPKMLFLPHGPSAGSVCEGTISKPPCSASSAVEAVPVSASSCLQLGMSSVGQWPVPHLCSERSALLCSRERRCEVGHQALHEGSISLAA